MQTELIAGRYRLQERIARSGLTELYRAADVSLGREAAVQILREEFAANPAAVQRFRREAHAAARLQHPNIVPIYDTGVQDGTYYIVMEHLCEPNLKQILVEYAPLPLRKALEVAIQVCEAIEYAHNADIVHRDIKPQSILFTDDGRAKVADFGIASAAVAVDPSATTSVLGTAHYTSPEQAQGHPASPQSDLYSLGAVLYEALTGRPPFEGDSAAEVAARHVRDRPKSPRALNANVTPSTEYVVMKALSKDLSRRYRTASEMLHDLRKLQEGARLEQTGVLPLPPESPAVAVSEPRETAVRSTPVVPRDRGRQAQRIRPRPAEAEGPPLRMALAVAAGLLAVLGIVGFSAWRLMYPNTPAARVQVPRVVGKTSADAVVILTQAGLAIGKETTQEDESRQPGTIISQSPGFGEFVDEGMAVDIVVAGGIGTVIVPDVVGHTPPDAATILKRGELVLGQTELRYDETVREGRIIEQDIRPGTNHPKGDHVNVVVSRGPPLDEGTMEPPDEPAADALSDDSSAYDHPDDAMQPTPVVGVYEENGVVNIQVALGAGRGPRKITVVKTDEEVRGHTVLERSVEPGEGFDERVEVKGSGTIEVYVDDELAHSHGVNPTSASPTPSVSEGNDTP